MCVLDLPSFNAACYNNDCHRDISIVVCNVLVLLKLLFLKSYFKSTYIYRGADKFLARPGKKQATATEDFDVHISYLLS